MRTKQTLWAGALVTATGLVWAAGGCSSNSHAPSSSTNDSGSDAKGGPDATSTDTGSDVANSDDTGSPESDGSSDTGSLASDGASDTGSPASDGSSDAGMGGDGFDGSTVCSGATPVALTVIDALDWCTVTVATYSSFNTGSLTVCVAAGTTVDLSATANVGFFFGPTTWHGTSGDNGSGDPGTITDAGAISTDSTTIHIAAGATSACAWVCCPGVGEPCPATYPCP